jgi:hypothetical protein
MLNILFQRKGEPLSGYFKVTPGVYIEDPAFRMGGIAEQAKALNDTLSTLSAYLCQFFYDDSELNKRPSLTGVSALMLKPDQHGHLYLRGVKSNKRDLTALLRKQLPAELSEQVLPIVAITSGDRQYDNRISSNVTVLHTGMSSCPSIIIDKLDEAYVSRRIATLHVVKPAYALVESLRHEAISEMDAILSGLYLHGVNFEQYDVADTLKSLYSFEKSLDKPSLIRIADNLKLLHQNYFAEPATLELTKKRVTDFLQQNWARMDNAYQIMWGDNVVGKLTKLHASNDIKVLSGVESAWVSATKRQVNGYAVPAILESVTPYFPPAIKSLLPERTSEEYARLELSVRTEAVLKDKPYALGGLYFVDSHSAERATNTISKINVSLNDVSRNFIFEADISDIDLNQDPAKFELFAHEIANKACMLSIPGFQLKAPVSLKSIENKSVLTFALPEDFTHIIKFPTNHPNKVGMVYSELFGMMMAKSCGVNTAVFRAVPTNVEVVSGMFPAKIASDSKSSLIQDIVATGEPAYITELFDRAVAGDDTLYMNEDFLSATKQIGKYNCDERGLNPIDDGDTLYPACAKPLSLQSIYSVHGVDILVETLKSRSTSFDDDAAMLYKQLITNTVIGNGDAHLKNFSLLHSSKGDGSLETRLSPAYDVLATRAISPKNFATKGVCLLGRSYTPSRNQIVNDGINVFGFSKSKAESLLDDTLNSAMHFVYSAATSPSVTSAFNNTKLGNDVLKRSLNYAKIQISALRANALNHDLSADDQTLFESMYPDEQYSLIVDNDSPIMSDAISPLKMPAITMPGTDSAAAPDESDRLTKIQRAALKL